MPIADNTGEAQIAGTSPGSAGHTSIAELFGHALWRGRWILGLSLLAGGVVGLLIARSIQPAYEAVAVLLMTESKDPEAVNSPETLNAIADSNATASRVLAALQLDRAPYNLTAGAFREKYVAIEPVRGSRMIRVKVTLPDPTLAARAADEVAHQTVELARVLNQQDTAYLRDYLAAQLAATQARKEQLQHDMVSYRANSQLELVETDADALLEQRSQLPKLVIDIAAEEARLATAERELKAQDRIVTAPRHPQLEGALLSMSERERRRASSGTDNGAPSRIGTFQTGAAGDQIAATARMGSAQTGADVPIQIQTSPSPSSQIGNSTSGSAQIGRVSSAPRPSAIQRYEQADQSQLRQPIKPSADQTSSGDDPLPIPPEAVGDFVNPVYEILNYQAATARTRLAALRRERDELVHVRKVNAQQLQTLSTMYRTQIELRKLQTEYDLAEKIYLDLSMRHEQARVQAVSRSSHVQVLDPAVPPTEPVAPRKRRIIAAGAVSGLLFAMAGVIVLAALGSRQGVR
jgi:uncharacterized protein involved in exopolysaccharide biosynthesis